MERRDVLKLGLAGVGTMALSKPAHALEHFVAASQKKWAVIYSTWCGSTQQGAGWINTGMGNIADVLDVKTSPQVSSYENIVIGAAIQMGDISQQMKDFLNSNKTALKEKVKGFFIVCGNGGNPSIPSNLKGQYIDGKLAQPIGITSNTKPSKVFPGKFDKSCPDAAKVSGISEYDNLNQADFKAFGVQIAPTSANAIRQEVPQRFELCQNYPNPFNPITMINYSLPKTSNVLLTVCSPSGQKLATLVSGLQTAGNYQVKWDGSKFAPGYYLYRLEAGSFTETRTARRVGR